MRIVKTDFARRITRSGLTSQECWGAETEDGTWRFVREDSPGTPWLVYHRSHPTPVSILGSLKKCERYVEAGHADFDLAQRVAS